jgi:hypothetical protein
MIDGGRTRHLKHKIGVYKKRQDEEMANLFKGQPLSKKHIRYLSKELIHHKNLLAFSIAIDQLVIKDSKAAHTYIYEMSEVFFILSKFTDEKRSCTRLILHICFPAIQ